MITVFRNLCTQLKRFRGPGAHALNPRAAALVFLFSLSGILEAIAGAPTQADTDRGKAVIAHRGASAYLPEHTLEAYAFGYAQGADFIEPDLMLTRDGVPIALHDRTLEATTDVADRFPDRARDDGRYYAIDFTPTSSCRRSSRKASSSFASSGPG